MDSEGLTPRHPAFWWSRFEWRIGRDIPPLVSAVPARTASGAEGGCLSAPVFSGLEHVGDDYIVLTQHPTYRSEAGWRNEAERPGYIRANKLRFLRPYQLKAIHSLQAAVNEGKDRFLFEMATGTGKTMTAVAVIKLFLRSGNARRVLFL